MKIEVLVVSPFLQNARILICEETLEGVLIDPGDEGERILQRAEQLKMRIQYILATHGHIDHIAAVGAIQKKTNLPFYIHKADFPYVESLPFQCARFGLPAPTDPIKVTKFIEDGETFTFGKCSAKVIHTPGHSPGSVGFLIGDDLIGGDTLFAGGIGRTDLPGSSFEQIEKAIHQRLYTLPENTIVHPGHGPNTTIGREKKNNPFVRGK